MAKQKILISACLLGQKVRYDGKDSLHAAHLVVIALSTMVVFQKISSSGWV